MNTVRKRLLRDEAIISGAIVGVATLVFYQLLPLLFFWVLLWGYVTLRRYQTAVKELPVSELVDAEPVEERDGDITPKARVIKRYIATDRPDHLQGIHIDDCPIPARVYRKDGTTFAHAYYDCAHCPVGVVVTDFRDEIRHVLCPESLTTSERRLAASRVDGDMDE